MTSCADLRVLFCASAGPRRGYGHLARSVSFARALGVRPLIAVRGTRQAREVALVLGADVVGSPTVRAIRALRPDVVVVDDPSTPHAQRHIDAARGTGALVVTAAAIARAIVAADPQARVRIAGGFASQPGAIAARVTWATARRRLAPELTAANVAVVGGAGVRHAAAQAVALLNSPHQRAARARRSTRFVAGGGASRAAVAVAALSEGN